MAKFKVYIRQVVIREYHIETNDTSNVLDRAVEMYRKQRHRQRPFLIKSIVSEKAEPVRIVPVQS